LKEEFIEMNSNKFLGLILLLAFIVSCQQPGKNKTGSEYMPDMAHSVAYEANTYGYYSLNRWGTEEDYYKFASPRLPVKGTIPRGAVALGSGAAYSTNGSVPYYYADTEEERARATKEIIKNPLPITEKGLAQGKLLYNINCGICHGDKGDGAGFLVRDDGKYPAQPANLLSDDFINASNGRFYHAIMYGKNVMGNYADKLSYTERWNVIHYIRSLQAGAKSLVYNEKANTLNKIDVAFGTLPKEAPAASEVHAVEVDASKVDVKKGETKVEVHTAEHKALEAKGTEHKAVEHKAAEHKQH
jgi:mono/diheme cytochrome c family protein